ncbi:hypothetical protein H072_1784 [Dactylellina haptotyla CBS 200.50]|uniref:Uncharacterized protein n=1 Tax=Dactylellina haptotyla (strain CBS 200.50) TaxID=1284197 RepID=S8BXJ2_DACHA|nr:hypothetical protein H072_1784 [Dactylellina haptotyla CBS 200.50]
MIKPAFHGRNWGLTSSKDSRRRACSEETSYQGRAAGAQEMDETNGSGARSGNQFRGSHLAMDRRIGAGTSGYEDGNYEDETEEGRGLKRG